MNAIDVTLSKEKILFESVLMIFIEFNKITHFQYDYNLLFLKRHKNANFAGTYVFPGGLIEKADADLRWKNLFKAHGCNEDSFTYLFPNANHRPDIFHGQKNELPREISLRISAIRETFEECGILLCKKFSESTTICRKDHHFSSMYWCKALKMFLPNGFIFESLKLLRLFQYQVMN